MDEIKDKVYVQIEYYTGHEEGEDARNILTFLVEDWYSDMVVRNGGLFRGVV